MKQPELQPEALVPVSQQPLARPSPRLDAVAILQAAVQGGITSENVAVVERMAALVERQQDRQSERDYAAALYALQQECQKVVALKDVDGKFRFAPYLDIWNAVEGPIKRNQFTLQWGQRNQGGMITKVLTLQHLGGHKREFEWTIRVGTNAPGTPAGAQAPVLDEQADSRAKRRLLLDVLNITVDTVSDAANVGTGELVTQEQSDALFQRLMATGADDRAQKVFLSIAGVDSWAKIRQSDLPILERLLTTKERGRAK